MTWKHVIFVALSFASCSFAKPQSQEQLLAEVHPDVGLRVPALVTKYGYPIEVHSVTTEDGYILTMHRIPHGKNNTSQANKPIAFLMHGLLCSSADWVLTGPQKGLAFLLADLGYDVWMGNARGNTYSRAHVSLNPDYNSKFWKFSWHEIGKYDLPKMIDYVLQQTQEQKIFYVAHSQGTTAFWVMTSLKPEYNDKIRLMIALAPVAFMENIPNVAFKLIAQFHSVINWVSGMLGTNEFMPSSKFMQLLGQTMCNDESILQNLCSNVLFLIAGYDIPQLNKTMIPVILSNTPAGASTRQFIHYAQSVASGDFAQYDYGAVENLVKYGKLHPPHYDLSKITAPVAMLYGDNDLLTSEEDIDTFRSKISHSVMKHRVKHNGWSHLDFLWATDVVPLLYNKVFDLLDRFRD